ncbi:MAG: AtpZ/AtpI family protein [Candidatus Saccharicenans sp.]|nr:MAG: hypothetical protein C0168_00440 [Candidatus Aminicenantes bacterium]HEK86604.1 AtpZ/AtpI family protein [Candidatus Aminicenantes bacterium]
MAEVSSLALVLPSSIAVGLAIGYFLDRWLKTEPWMLLAWTIFGIIAGLMNLFKGIKKYLGDNQSPSRRTGPKLKNQSAENEEKE